MLRWFRKTYPSYDLQPLLPKRQRELEEARAFNAWLGERRLAQEGQRHLDDVSRLTEAVPPGTSAALRARRAQGRRTRSGRSCATVNEDPSGPRLQPAPALRAGCGPPGAERAAAPGPAGPQGHFYLDDFVQSSEDPNPQPLQHTPLRAIPEEGFRTPAEATDEDLARMRQGGGNRFGEDDLAGDPEADALTNNGQGPPSITGRLRSAADGAQAAADLVGAGAAGLAAVQAFRSQLPQDAAEYVRMNVLPRPGPQPQPPPQIIGRRRAPPGRGRAARAGGGARRSAGHRGDGSGGCGGGRGCRCRRGRGRGLWLPGGPGRRGRCFGGHGARLLERWLPRRESAQRRRLGWPWGSQAAQPTAWPAARAGCWRTRSSGLSRAARTRPCRTSGPPTV